MWATRPDPPPGTQARAIIGHRGNRRTETRMAGTLKVADTIESSGFPLGFKVAQGAARSPLMGMDAAEDTLKVEVRAMTKEGATG